MPIEVTVASVALDEARESPVVLLQDLAGRYTLPIYVGLMEAAAIAMSLEGVEMERPMTHDLLLTTIEALGGRVDRVEVTSLIDHTFHAVLVLTTDEETIEVDARPSDGIAIALRAKAPLYVAEEVLEEAGHSNDEDPEPDEAGLDQDQSPSEEPPPDVDADAWRLSLELMDKTSKGGMSN